MAAARTRYEILGHLASGGMGEILLARRRGPAGFEQRVVLKRPLGATTRAHVTALVDEARLLARIHHPNVCQVHDLEEGDAGYFLVLEHLEGMSCWTLLVEAERAAVALPPGALCGLLEQVCDGLEAIHGLAARDGRPAGIVHRDISPGNLFVTEAGVAKILDLGIAKTDERDTTAPGAGPRGKLPYLSPEQVAGRAVDRRADVFSLGLVLYDLACGRPPPDRVGALAAPELALDAVPAPLAEVILTAIAIEPARRFATASGMGAALRRAGSAVGGSFGRAELAAWLDTQFGGVLAARRAQLSGTGDGAAAESPGSRRVELRSLVRELGEDDAATVVDAMPVEEHSAHEAAPLETGHATAELAPPPLLIREHAHPAIRQVEALVAAGTVAPRRPRAARRGHARIAIAIAAALAVAPGATAWWRSAGGPSTQTPPAAVTVEARPPVTTGEPRTGTAAAASATMELPAPALARSPAESAAPGAEPATASSAAAPSTEAPTAQPPPAAPEAPPTAKSPAAAAAGPPAPPATPPPARRVAPATAPPARRSPGRLSIDSEPFAVIELDGKPLGTTPLYQLAVAPGRHQLRAETGDGRVQRRAVDVAPGAVSAVVLRWAAGAAGATGAR
ncbi:MAG TPA: serine/threonine-protein kinase [Kofleriaceae bacterium]|jgi:serine/threonine-protein kinase|nr:serine/threonine-protein kinase [Kofleriaceae bacterium]